MNIKIKTDNKSIKLTDNQYQIKISSKANNGLSLDPTTGIIKVQKGANGKDGVDGTMNIPGSGIAGSTGQGTIVIRCNSTVTRLQTDDPYQEDGGISIIDLVNHILEGDGS